MSLQPKYHLDIPSLLVRMPLFQELSSDQLAHIAAQVREKRLAKGKMLFQKGDSPQDGMFSVVFGQVKLAFPSPSGNEKVVDIVEPNQLFGEGVIFMDQPYPLFAEAVIDSLLLHIPKTLLFELIGHDPTFARQMLAGMSMRLHSLIQDVESYSLRSSAQRVVGYLMQLCPHKSKDDCATNLVINLPISKQLIASRLNLTPETLSRIFHDLAAAKLISVAGKKITIHNLTRLQEYDL